MGCFGVNLLSSCSDLMVALGCRPYRRGTRCACQSASFHVWSVRQRAVIVRVISVWKSCEMRYKSELNLMEFSFVYSNFGGPSAATPDLLLAVWPHLPLARLHTSVRRESLLSNGFFSFVTSTTFFFFFFLIYRSRQDEETNLNLKGPNSPQVDFLSYYFFLWGSSLDQISLFRTGYW